MLTFSQFHWLSRVIRHCSENRRQPPHPSFPRWPESSPRHPVDRDGASQFSSPYVAFTRPWRFPPKACLVPRYGGDLCITSTPVITLNIAYAPPYSLIPAKAGIQPPTLAGRRQPHFHDWWCRWKLTWAIATKIVPLQPPIGEGLKPAPGARRFSYQVVKVATLMRYSERSEAE